MAKTSPPIPHNNSGYDPKKGDHYGERDNHGGYVPDKDPGTRTDGYSQAHGQGKQAERTNAKVQPANAKPTTQPKWRIRPSRVSNIFL